MIAEEVNSSFHKSVLGSIVDVFASHEYVNLEILSNVSNKIILYIKNYCNIDNYVTLSTCNRLEFFLDTYDENDINCIVKAFNNYNIKNIKIVKGFDALIRIMRIASGLESRIIGEPEILGQVKTAWLNAKKLGQTSQLLDRIFHAAILAGKRVRSETCIGRGSIGYPSLAVKVASELLDGLNGKNIAVLGTGSAALKIIKILNYSYNFSKLYIISKHRKNLESALKECEKCKAIHVSGDSKIPQMLDVLFVATTSNYNLNKLFNIKNIKIIIDISMPPLVGGDLDNAVTYKELEELSIKSLNERLSCVPNAEKIIIEESNKLINKLLEQNINNIIFILTNYAKHLAGIEAQNMSTKLDIDKDIIELFLERSFRKLLHPIFVTFREAPRRGYDCDGFDDLLYNNINNMR